MKGIVTYLESKEVFFFGLLVHTICIFLGVHSYEKLRIFSYILDALYFMHCIMQTAIGLRAFKYETGLNNVFAWTLVVFAIPTFVMYFLNKYSLI